MKLILLPKGVGHDGSQNARLIWGEAKWALAAEEVDCGGTVKALSSAEGALSGALGRLMVTMEAYPDLKASQNMMQVQEELTTTENKIAFSRQAYNDSVMHFNVLRESFPDSIIANMFNFQAAQMFEVENEAVREVPKVDFS